MTSRIKSIKLSKSFTNKHKLLFLLFLLGIIAIVSPETYTKASTGLWATPLIFGTVDNPNACPQCGEKISTEGIFCMNCGYKHGDKDQQPLAPSQQLDPYDDRRYQDRYDRRYRSRKTTSWYDNNICFYICLFDCCTDCICTMMDE